MGLSPPPFPSKGIEVGEPETLNRYAYANGNPISNVDPFGMSAERISAVHLDRDYFKQQFGIDLSPAMEPISNWKKGTDPLAKSKQFISGVMNIATGAAAIIMVIATDGVATPVAITILTAASGGACITFGSFDIGESLTGKNPLKSLMGDQAYYITETGCSLTAGIGTGYISYKALSLPASYAASTTEGVGDVAGSGGRLGNTATRAQNSQIASYLESEGWDITGGGGRLKEGYLPGLNGSTKGSNYVDITAIKNGETIRINTVDIYKNGQMTIREANAANLINLKTGGNIITIPKGTGLGELPDMLK